jgi:hypothetical protein
MTQEDKELLLKDLCSRLPYGVKVESTFINPDTKEHKLCGIEIFDATSLLMVRDKIGEFKPYLFPMSNMTEEQREEWQSLMIRDSYGSILYHTIESFDYLYKNHIDIRGLIEKGLAIDATNLNIY